MANPQLENGYLRIANELWERWAKTRVPGCAEQVLKVIIRQTYGFNKKSDRIALSQLSEDTGMAKPHILRAIRLLVDMNLIAKKGNEKGVTYWFNKDYDTWKPLPKKVTLPKKVITVAKEGNETLSKKVTTVALLGTTKDILKDTLKKNTTKDTSADKPPIVGKGKKGKKETDPDHANFVKFWHDKYEEQFGRKYQMESGKDGILIGKMLHFARNGRPSDNEEWKTELAGMVDLFFRTSNVGVAGHTIGTFYYRRHELREAWNE